MLNFANPPAAMQCTLLIPRLFWHPSSADAVAHGLDLHALKTLLARASVEHYSALTPEAWLCQAFQVERQHDWPVAPLTLAVDGGEPADAYWLRADPVHIKVGREGLRLVDNTLFDVAIEDARALVAKLNAHFADLGVTFHAPHPRRWYAKVARAPELATHPISEVAGKDVQQYLPQGRDALAWHGTFNEAQMLLHEHPVNDARAARGEPELNSVWFWGGGSMPGVPGRPFASVAADDATATALAAAADIDPHAVPADARTWIAAVDRDPRRPQSHLVVLDDLTTAVNYEDANAWRTRVTSLEAAWFSPLTAALRSGQLSELAIVVLGERSSCRFTVRRPDLMKIWRRPKPLSTYA
jgi:hypothetical protein